MHHDRHLEQSRAGRKSETARGGGGEEEERVIPRNNNVQGN